jgi:prepilin-type N-terminal cleavage/methylation domain-containing protein
MSCRRGFSLIETMVALLVATLIVLSTGLLGTRMFHRRSSSASLSAATSIAQKRIEELRIETLANKTENLLVDETGTTAIGGPYSRTLRVEDGPAVGTKSMKRVTVTVQHVTNPEVRVQLVTYFRVKT